MVGLGCLAMTEGSSGPVTQSSQLTLSAGRRFTAMMSGQSCRAPIRQAGCDDGHVSEHQSGSIRKGDLPTVTLFCGLPGSGKTTLAKRLEAKGRGIRLCTDDWQTELGIDHTDTDFHGQLQLLLYRHALTLLRRGVSVILEDGLWMAEERTEKFLDARACGSRIDFHVFNVPYETLWSRLQDRNMEAATGAYPMTEADLRRAWDLFQCPSLEELGSVDSYEFHAGGRE